MIPLGPQAQAQLRPYLKPLNAQAYIFSPQDAVAERIERMHDARATPLNQGNRPGTNVKAKPKRTPGNRYDVAAYRRAIARACDSAFPPPDELLAPDKTALLSKWRSDRRWHPHQLRHSAATDIRRQFGLEAAQHVLGHATLSITEVYAERNGDVAKRIAAAIG
jgi:integrase